MRIVYLILAHKNPAHLLRLINRLRAENVTFCVHVDKSTDIEPFIRLIQHKEVKFLKQRRSSPWGRIGLVKATIDAIRIINKTEANYDYIVLLSGQDYPIKSNMKIFEKLSSNKGKVNYIHCHPFIPGKDLEVYDRIEKYYFTVNKKMFVCPNPNPVSVQAKVFQAFARHLFKYPRPFLPGISPVFGSQWWALNKEAIHYILYYLDTNPRFTGFFKRTLIPDEMFFQTILYGTGNQKIIETIEADNWLTFNHWNRPRELYPQPLYMIDYEPIIRSDKLFARKFEEGISDELLQRIDEFLNNDDEI